MLCIKGWIKLWKDSTFGVRINSYAIMAEVVHMVHRNKMRRSEGED